MFEIIGFPKTTEFTVKVCDSLLKNESPEFAEKFRNDYLSNRITDADFVEKFPTNIYFAVHLDGKNIAEVFNNEIPKQ